MTGDRPRFSYPDEISRILDKLADYELPLIDSRILDDVLLNNFNPIDFAYAREMRSAKAELDWHLVRILTSGPLARDYDPWVLARSAKEAFQFVAINCDEHRLSVSDIRDSNSKIEILNGDECLMSIERVEFTKANSESAKRIETATKGLLKDLPEHYRKLAKKIGLPVPSNDKPRRDNERYRIVLIPSPNSWASHFRNTVQARTGVELKQHQACELVAAMFGFDSYHHLSAAHHRFAYESTVTAIVEDTGGAVPDVQIFRNPIDALTVFSAWYRQNKNLTPDDFRIDTFLGKLSIGGRGLDSPHISHLEIWLSDDGGVLPQPDFEYAEDSSLSENLYKLINVGMHHKLKARLSRTKRGIDENHYLCLNP
jgi:hypothetical protein